MADPWEGKLPEYVLGTVACSFPGCYNTFRRLVHDGPQAELEDRLCKAATDAGWAIDRETANPAEAWDYCPDHKGVDWVMVDGEVVSRG